METLMEMVRTEALEVEDVGALERQVLPFSLQSEKVLAMATMVPQGFQPQEWGAEVALVLPDIILLRIIIREMAATEYRIQ